jgi:putative DNA primase/helicase
MSFISLKQHMESNGIYILGDVNFTSTKFQRFKDATLSHKGKSIYVKLFDNLSGAVYGDWRLDIQYTWFSQGWNRLTHEEKRKREYESELAKKQLKYEQEEASNNARIIYNLSNKIPSNQIYIQRKKITPYCAKEYADMLVIPVYSISGQIQTIQFIYEDGFKKFQEGAPVSDGFLILGKKFSNPIRLVEGWATGCTVHEILKERSVIVTFTCHNMKKIAYILKKRFPSFEQIIFADNDFQKEKNYGLLAAYEIQARIGAKVIYPIFPQDNAKKIQSDFNDLACVAGFDEAKKQIMDCLV